MPRHSRRRRPTTARQTLCLCTAGRPGPERRKRSCCVKIGSWLNSPGIRAATSSTTTETGPTAVGPLLITSSQTTLASSRASRPSRAAVETTLRYVDEHVLEANMVKVFVETLSKKTGTFCDDMVNHGWQRTYRFAGQPTLMKPWKCWLHLPGRHRSRERNGPHHRVCQHQGERLQGKQRPRPLASEERVDQAIRSMKNVMAYKYMIRLSWP